MKSIIHRRGISGLFILFFLVLPVSASSSQPSEDNIGEYHSLHEDLSFHPSEYGDGWIVNDENSDGVVDYAIYFDEDGYKVFEVIDFDRNGSMDDFYFYSRGVLVRQELDQNDDQLIDLWVYITEGVYVQGYERDSNYDGKIDVVKLYGQDE